MDRDQRVRDPIHNLIKFSKQTEIDSILWELIQTRPFQRLRRIKQLGFSDFVYPGASHTRFSHSLGALQTARFMLEALERNGLIHEKEEQHKHWKNATLCATLLHDIGHGPYSHVFEEVASSLGIKKAHEEYTSELIQAEEISQILCAHSENLYEKTKFFFSTEPGSNQYSRIVSSQLDADRLDFLVRDRYHTGIRFGAIDLAWIFDSLEIRQLLTDMETGVTELTPVIQEKGVSAVEEYLTTYAHMYHHVYFHKTTRGVQHLVKDFLKEILSDPDSRNRIPDWMEIKTYFEKGEHATVDDYIQLDDFSVIELIKWASNQAPGRAQLLADRFFRRDIYKPFEIPKKPHEEIPREKAGRFYQALQNEGLYFHTDKPPAKGYKQYDIVGPEFFSNIIVYDSSTGEPTPIRSVSPTVEHLAKKPSLRFYFWDADQREQAREIWRKL